MLIVDCSVALYPGDTESVNDDNIATMEEWLRNNKEPEDMVKDYMKQTAKTRHDWIKRSDCCVKNILNTYPRLLDAGMVCGPVTRKDIKLN